MNLVHLAWWDCLEKAARKANEANSDSVAIEASFHQCRFHLFLLVLTAFIDLVCTGDKGDSGPRGFPGLDAIRGEKGKNAHRQIRWPQSINSFIYTLKKVISVLLENQVLLDQL